MLDVSRSASKKQIRTSKISVFIVSAGQLKTVDAGRAANEQVHKKPYSQKYMKRMSTKTIMDVSLSASKKQIRTSKIFVFVILAGQLKNSRHWQGCQRAGALKAPFTTIHETNEHKNHVGCLSKCIKKADQGLEKIRFYSLGWPTENS